MAIDKLSQVQDKALLAVMGLLPLMSEDDSDINSDSDCDTTLDSHGDQIGTFSLPCQADIPNPDTLCQEMDTSVSSCLTTMDGTSLAVSFGALKEFLQQGSYNWFVVVDYLEHTPQASLILENFHCS